MSKEIIHSLLLIISIVLSFLIAKTNLAQYDLQIAAFLFVVLFLAKRFLSTRSRLIESIIFTLVVLIIVNTTGGLASPFFFLIYFLLFSLSLLLEPIISIIATLTLVAVFLITIPENQGLSSLLPLFSLAFLTPFALYLGKEHIESQKSKVKSQKLQEETFLFLSLMLKNYLKNIRTEVENFIGDHQLDNIKKYARKMEKLIEKFEKTP